MDQPKKLVGAVVRLTGKVIEYSEFGHQFTIESSPRGRRFYVPVPAFLSCGEILKKPEATLAKELADEIRSGRALGMGGVAYIVSKEWLERHTEK